MVLFTRAGARLALRSHMSEEPERPDAAEEAKRPPPIDIQPVLAYTAEIAATRPWGLVTGSGATPEHALTDMRDQVRKQGEELFNTLWNQGENSKPKPQWWKNIQDKVPSDNARKLKGTFSIGAARIAYGQIDGEPRWVAYGTLLTDSTGDGTNWLQPPEG